MCWVTLIRDHLHRRGPLGKLGLPVGHGSQRNDDKVRAALALGFDQESDERYGLDGLAQTLEIEELATNSDTSERKYHLIRKDTVELVVVQAHHPL